MNVKKLKEQQEGPMMISDKLILFQICLASLMSSYWAIWEFKTELKF